MITGAEVFLATVLVPGLRRVQIVFLRVEFVGRAFRILRMPARRREANGDTPAKIMQYYKQLNVQDRILQMTFFDAVIFKNIPEEE